MHATTQPEGTLQITMTQEEVATLVDLCFAGAASDMVPRRKDTQLRICLLYTSPSPRDEL